MTLDLAGDIRTALIAESTISGLLSEWKDEPAVFTRTPIPPLAVPPFMVVSDAVSITDADGLTSDRPIVIRDILVYGHQPDQYRTVEQIGYSVRELFHRERFSVISDTYDIIDIIASGPRGAPTSDEELVGRLVSLNFFLRKKP